MIVKAEFRRVLLVTTTTVINKAKDLVSILSIVNTYMLSEYSLLAEQDDNDDTDTNMEEVSLEDYKTTYDTLLASEFSIVNSTEYRDYLKYLYLINFKCVIGSAKTIEDR